MNNLGVEIIRFSDHDILTNIEGVSKDKYGLHMPPEWGSCDETGMVGQV